MKKILGEFKSFAVKGNVVDLAIAVVIGGAFGRITNSFVNDVIMPPLGFIIGGVDFSNLSLMIGEKVFLAYGNFIQAIVNFLIIAWAVFIAVKLLNRMKKKEEEAPAEPKKPSREVELLTEIRDALKEKNN